MMTPIVPNRPAPPGWRLAMAGGMALMMAGSLTGPAGAASAAALPPHAAPGTPAWHTPGQTAPAAPDVVAESAVSDESTRAPARLMQQAQATPDPAPVQPAGATGAEQVRSPVEDDALPPDAEAIMRSPRFRQLAHELRCLVCQNQTLLDSHAPLAQDLRHEVVRLVASGMDDAQVKQYLVDRYGEFVLYRPAWSWRNAVLWLGPALMLLLAGGVAWRILAQRKRVLAGALPPRTAPAGTPTSTTAPRTSGTDAGAATGAHAGAGTGDGACTTANTTAGTEAGSRAAEALRQVDALLARSVQNTQDAPADGRTAPGDGKS